MGRMSTTTYAAQMFRRIIDPDAGTLSSELARYVRSLDFPAADHALYEARRRTSC